MRLDQQYFRENAFENFSRTIQEFFFKRQSEQMESS